MLQTTDHHRKATAMLSYDDALHALSVMDSETEAEREEREATESGNEWPLLAESEVTRRFDTVALDSGAVTEEQAEWWDAREDSLY